MNTAIFSSHHSRWEREMDIKESNIPCREVKGKRWIGEIKQNEEGPISNSSRMLRNHQEWPGKFSLKAQPLRWQPSLRHFHTSKAKVFSLLTSQFVPDKNKFHNTDFHKKIAPGCNGDSHHRVGVGWDCAQTVRLVHNNQVPHYGSWIDFFSPLPSHSYLATDGNHCTNQYPNYSF